MDGVGSQGGIFDPRQKDVPKKLGDHGRIPVETLAVVVVFERTASSDVLQFLELLEKLNSRIHIAIRQIGFRRPARACDSQDASGAFLDFASFSLWVAFHGPLEIRFLLRFLNLTTDNTDVFREITKEFAPTTRSPDYEFVPQRLTSSRKAKLPNL